MDSLTLRMDINELGDLINRIAVEAKTMLEYSENFENLDRSTLKNFAEWTVSPQSGAVQGMLNRMDTIVAGSADLQLIGKQSLLSELSLYLQVGISAKGFCSVPKINQIPLHSVEPPGTRLWGPKVCPTSPL